MPPRVSVIIATYNWSSVLPYSIGSVLRQTLSDFEVLVVGDGCTDDSEQVVASIDDPRVRWISLPRNSGHQSAPNNEGLRQARGELIAYLGHDDLWLPHHLEAHLAAMEQSSADVTHSLIALVDPDGDVWPAPLRSEQEAAWVPPSCTVHRCGVTEALGGWGRYCDLNTPPDIDLWRAARRSGFRFTFVPRLTAVKFPASFRRNVYQSRPSHEQKAWSARIAAEPDLEVSLLARMIVESRDVRRISYGELVRQFIAQTLTRVRRRAANWRRGTSINDVRRFKGL
jgi:glycosyltransferase involved in cell wall biosynthesis